MQKLARVTVFCSIPAHVPAMYCLLFINADTLLKNWDTNTRSIANESKFCVVDYVLC